MSDREVHQLLGHKILLIFKPEYQQDQKKKKTPKKKKPPTTSMSAADALDETNHSLKGMQKAHEF